MACSLSHNIQSKASFFITVILFSKLLRKVRFSHNFSKYVHLVTVKFCIQVTPSFESVGLSVKEKQPRIEFSVLALESNLFVGVESVLSVMVKSYQSNNFVLR